MGLDRGVLCCHHGPGTWKWLKLLDVTHLGPGPRKPRLGGSFRCFERGAKQCCVSFPSIFSSLFPPAL